MNQRQKLVQQKFLNNEEAVIKRLKTVYDQSMKDINGKISNLDSSIAQLQKAYNDIDGDDIGDLAKAVLGSKKNFTPEEAKETLQSMIQSKVYQKKYQEGLQKQVGDVLDKMHTEQFKTVSEYLDKCYEEGFIGTMYDLQGQGIPMCFPLDQEQMVRAVQLDSKIVEGYYQRLGEDVATLKKRITAEVSRGISSGMRWEQVAQQLANKTTIGYTNAIRIARTEGHRIQCQAGMDACGKARDMGADVVKQWDSTLDGVTRHSHVILDGEVRELDEVFSNGLRFPGDPHGAAAEVINCRCALLQRARWALKEKVSPDTGEVTFSDGKFTKFDRESGKIVDFSDIDDYNTFKQKYLKAATQPAGSGSGIIATPQKTSNDKYNKLLDVFANESIDYNPVESHITKPTEAEIIAAIAGGDKTVGSCASVGIAYVGQKHGLKVLDFRDGASRRWFSGKAQKLQFFEALGAKPIEEDSAKSNLTNGKRILSQMQKGKEYYLSVGRHASIVRLSDDGKPQYLELQSANNNGWHDFNSDVRETLKGRFGCSSSGSYWSAAYLTDIDQFPDDDEFKTLLGYINTAESMQRKGLNGTIK